jgi:membrane protein DedA with SNARE-associated domain
MTDFILQSIQSNSEWAWLIVFLIAFIESMAILGLFLPGWILLVGIGVMIGTDVLSFYPVVVSAYLGAVIGEYLSYHIGYHYHDRILEWSWVARQQKLIDRSHDFFEKHGAIGVFFGRFIGPVRAVIPLVAGISEMPKKTFFWVNLTSGLLWAPLYLIPGILIGAAYELDGNVSRDLMFIAVVIAAIVWMAVYQTNKWRKHKKRDFVSKINILLINCLLAWVLLFTSVFVLVKSPYMDFVTEISMVLWSKLS